MRQQDTKTPQHWKTIFLRIVKDWFRVPGRQRVRGYLTGTKTRIFQLFCSWNGWKLTGTKNTESWKQETPKYCENETLNPDVTGCIKKRLKLSALSLNKPADLREEESRVVFTGAYPLSLASPSKTLKRPVVNLLSFKNLSWFFWESLVQGTKIQLTVGFVPQNGGCCKVWRRSQSGRKQSDIIVRNTKNTKL